MVEVETKRTASLSASPIFREVFEREVDFVHVLAEERKPPQLKVSTTTLPIIRDNETLAGKTHGLLTTEQRRWSVAKPNDSKTGNPIHKKHEKQSALNRAKPSTSQLRSLEVRGLPGQVSAIVTQSDIVERIQTSRKERHEATLEDMHQELSVLGADFEAQIEENCQLLKDKLETNDQEINSLFDRISDNEMLVRYTMPQLTDLWNAVTKQGPVRWQWISELDTTLDRMEKERTSLINDILKAFSERLATVAFLLPADIHRLVADEVLEINLALLSNRKSYAELQSKLMTADIERERCQHNMWVNRLTDWRVLNCELAQHMFGEFMNSPAVLNPPEVDKLLSLLSAEQQLVNKRRLELISKLSKVRPPVTTKTFVYEWNSSVKALQEALENLHCKYLAAFDEAQAAVNSQCIDEMERCRVALLESGVCSEQTVYDIINQGFLPMIEQREKHASGLLDEIQKSLESVSLFQESQLQSLFQFAQGAAHLWDEHQLALAEQEKALQAELDKSRQIHDTANQNLEADLDLVMDRMRQDGSEEKENAEMINNKILSIVGRKTIEQKTTLAVSLKQSLTLLDRIKDGYSNFHDEVASKVEIYPSAVQAVLVAYDTAVLKYFSVDRKLQMKGKKKVQKVKGKADGRQTNMGGRHTVLTSLGSKDTSIGEVLSTASGATFFVLADPGEHGLGPNSVAGSVFLTESDTSNQQVYAWTENVMIPEGTFMEIRKSMRIEFLEHLEVWKVKAIDLANDLVKAKKEEIDSELDLRLHIHQPRASRIEMDIHNVRAGELVMHRERVKRHAQGVSSTLNEQKSQCTVLSETQKLLTAQFCSAVKEMMEAVQAGEKANQLVAIQKQVQTSQTDRLSAVRSALRSYRTSLDEVVNGLRYSNSKFRKSLKAFSEGGNFCREEIDEFSMRLGKVGGRIDSEESTLQCELNTVETKLVNTTTAAVKQWEEKFRHHLSDVTFVEKVTRWLTNIQVKIKSEVAASNTQTQGIVDAIDQLEKRCDAVESPSPDKEQLTADDLFASLPDVFQVCKSRVSYLDCSARKTASEPPENALHRPSVAVSFDEGSTTGRVSATGRVSVTGQVSATGRVSAAGRVSVTGRASQTEGLPQEPLSAINLTKSILNHTQSKRQRQMSVFQQQNEGRKSATSMPCPLPGMDLSARMMSISVPSDLEKSKTGKLSAGLGGRRKTIFGRKVEKKHESFGEDKDENPESFLPRIRKILTSGRDGLFSVCETFYKQKANRLLTRPELIHDSVEECTEALNTRLQSYRAQAESYRNSCIQEFADQLTRLSAALIRVPAVMFRDMLTEEFKRMDQALMEKKEQHTQCLDELNRQKAVHELELRVVLGHPSNSEKLAKLNEDEIGRINKVVEAIEENSAALQTCLVSSSQSFLSHICELSERSLLAFDNITTTQDIISVGMDTKKKSTKELLREARRRDGADEGTATAKPGGMTWPGLPAGELTKEISSGKKLLPGVKTTKVTDVHQAVVSCRDQVYQDYLVKFQSLILEVEHSMQYQLDTVNRWREKWQQSVVKVRQLY